MSSVPTELTPAQTRTLMAILWLRQQGSQCTLDDLARHLHRHRSTVYDTVRRLRIAGFVRWQPFKKNTLEPLVKVVRNA